MIAQIPPHIQLPLALRVALLYVVVLASLATFQLNKPDLYQSPVAFEVATVEPVTTPTVTPKKVQTGKPISIVAPSVGIDLDVVDGEYDKKSDTWTLTDDSAQFALMTSQPNDSTGNTFIYGHSTSAVFAPLINLEDGDKVMINTDNDLQFTYRYSGVKIVDPTTTSILSPTKKPRLTLMMCEGVFDQHRRVMIFDLVEVKS